jgi:hypothetical protein
MKIKGKEIDRHRDTEPTESAFRVFLQKSAQALENKGSKLQKEMQES